MATANQYLDQAVIAYKCGTFNSALKTSDSEYESRTYLVGWKLQRAKARQPTPFANHVSQPTLQQYLDRIQCKGDVISTAELNFIEGQIELMYLEAGA